MLDYITHHSQEDANQRRILGQKFGKIKTNLKLLFCMCASWLLGELCTVDLLCSKDYLNKHNHIPDCFNQDDVWPTLSKLFVVRETDFEQIAVCWSLDISFSKWATARFVYTQTQIKDIYTCTFKQRMFKTYMLIQTSKNGESTLSMSLYGSCRLMKNMDSVRNCSLNSCCLI